MGLIVTKEATRLAIIDFIKKEGKAGRLTLCMKAKKGRRGTTTVEVWLSAGEHRIVDLPPIKANNDDELQLSGVSLMFTHIDGIKVK